MTKYPSLSKNLPIVQERTNEHTPFQRYWYKVKWKQLIQDLKYYFNLTEILETNYVQTNNYNQ